MVADAYQCRIRCAETPCGGRGEEVLNIIRKFARWLYRRRRRTTPALDVTNYIGMAGLERRLMQQRIDAARKIK